MRAIDASRKHQTTIVRLQSSQENGCVVDTKYPSGAFGMAWHVLQQEVEINIEDMLDAKRPWNDNGTIVEVELGLGIPGGLG